MKLTLVQFVTLDGVSQGPGSSTEDTSDGFTAGGWLVPHMDEAFVARASQWLDEADGLLLGRRTYEAFARDWPQMTDPADPFAGRMNGLPKYVVSGTLAHGSWDPTTVLTGVDDVRDLLDRPGRELQVHGSARLGNALLGAGLVDLVRLVVAPTVIGQGRRLFAHPVNPSGFRVRRHDLTPGGLLLLELDRVGAAATAEFAGTAQFAR